MKKLGIRFLKQADYFRQPIELLFNGKKAFSTVLGGMLSLAVYAITIAVILSMSSDLINKKNPKATMSSVYQLEAPFLNMSARNMVYVAYFLDANFSVFYDPSYLEFSLYYFHVTRDGEMQTAKYDMFNFTNCTMYFPYFKELGFEDKFFSNNLQYGFCFDNKEITIGGNFYSKEFSNILVRVEKCKNITTNGKCKSDAEIIEKLKGGFFEFYYVNKYIDLNNFTHPFVDFFANYFVLLDPLSRKMVDIFFKLCNISSDIGLIFAETDIKTNVILDDVREQISTAEKDEKLIDFYINSSNNVLVYTRIYLKLQELAATVGGILKVLLLLGYVVTYYPAEYQMYETIINTLFRIRMKKNTQNLSDCIKSLGIVIHREQAFKNLNDAGKKMKNSSILSLSHPANQVSVEHILNAKSIDISNQLKNKKIVDSSVKVKIDINEKINFLKSQLVRKYVIGIYHILSINCFFICSKKAKRNALLFNLLYEKMTKYLDYLSIIRTLQQFNKLKKIIFTKSQRKLFSFYNVPIITEGETLQKSKAMTEEYYDVYMRYLKAKKKNDRINLKLITNFDWNLRLIFDSIERESFEHEQ